MAVQERKIIYLVINISMPVPRCTQSQKHNVPIFALTDEQMEQGGVILKNMKESRDNFYKVFSELATEIDDLTDFV
jgi:hypothetical protein